VAFTEFTITVTLAVAEHPLEVTTKVYIVVCGGFATGFAMFALDNPTAGVHEKLALGAFVLADKLVEAPEQILTFWPALAVGKGLTVTITWSVALQAPLETVTV
jgi:hypothetical protein